MWQEKGLLKRGVYDLDPMIEEMIQAALEIEKQTSLTRQNSAAVASNPPDPPWSSDEDPRHEEKPEKADHVVRRGILDTDNDRSGIRHTPREPPDKPTIMIDTTGG